MIGIVEKVALRYPSYMGISPECTIYTPLHIGTRLFPDSRFRRCQGGMSLRSFGEVNSINLHRTVYYVVLQLSQTE
jgi:hypothetical protein